MRFCLVLVLAILTACGKNDEFKISRFQFQEAMGDSSTLVIDVRTPEEYGVARIPGSVNYNVRSETFEDDLKNLDKSTPLYLYCRSGRRSNTAAQKLKEMGFETVYDLEGGILGWTEEGFAADSSDLDISH